jgi:tetratricopeptide (TPR) repeat protein
VIAVDGDHAAFYRARGDAFNSMERYADAIEDLRRADQLWPQYPPTLELLANVMLRAGKYQDGLNAINLAIQIGGPRPDDEQLRTSLLMQLQRTSQAKAAAGGDLTAAVPSRRSWRAAGSTMSPRRRGFHDAGRPLGRFVTVP